MHFAAHGHTAAEIIYLRADSAKDNMGLTVFKGRQPRKRRSYHSKKLFRQKRIKYFK